MNSRDKILESVLRNQPQSLPLPDVKSFPVQYQNAADKFCEVFTEIGGFVFFVESMGQVKELLRMSNAEKGRIVTTIDELDDIAEKVSPDMDPHSYEDVEVAVIRGHFSVAENGAVWLTEDMMGHRILPYICQHLSVVIEEKSIVNTLHEAYEKIGEGSYGFGGFISGPSKTADIEQALVLGAHGPLSMTVFVIR